MRARQKLRAAHHIARAEVLGRSTRRERKARARLLRAGLIPEMVVADYRARRLKGMRR